MSRINSSAKGSKVERALSKLLSSWTGVEFQRVPQSGGLRWGSGLMITGDVIPADPRELVEFPFSVESKVRKSITFQELLLNQNSSIQEFWDQSSTDAKRVDKLPMVLFRYDFLEKGLFFVVISYKVFVKLKRDLETGNLGQPIKYFNYSNSFVIFTSDYLFNVPYKIVKEKLWNPKSRSLG